MSDQGFDFRKAPEVREPKRFEPPPWEREAFEELERRKSAEAQARLDVHARASVETDARAQREAQALTPPVPQGAGPSETEVLEMLASLAAEEPDARTAATQVTIGAVLVLLPLGLMLVAWGMAALAKAGAASTGAGVARTGALVLLVFGAGFVASAAWLAFRLMRQRGVL